MTYLTSNQLKQYTDEGFVSPINIFSKDKQKRLEMKFKLLKKKCLAGWIKLEDIMLL